METPNFYAIIPADIRYSKELSMFQKLLYAEITALTQKDWYCWASNSYFAELYDMWETYISKQISDLAKKWFLEVFIDKKAGNKRSIYVGEIRKASWKTVSTIAIAENNKTSCTKVQDPYCEKVQENNININNKNNKEKNIKKEKSFFNFFEDLKILKNSNFDFEKFVDKSWEIIFSNENFCEELKYFYEMRKDIKAPMTARALELLCLKARNYNLDIFIKMIQQSTENSWKWIFELKNNFQNFWKNNPGVVISTSGEPPYCASYEAQKAERLRRLEEYKKQHPNE